MATVIVGLVADIMDGIAARKLNAKSQFGAAFDQLADLTCFGVGPAVFYMRANLDGKAGFNFYEIACLITGYMYVACSVARIARELVVTNMARPLFFVGIPTNLACPILVFSVAYSPRASWLPLLAIVLSILMISNLSIPKDLSIGYWTGWDFLHLRGDEKDKPDKQT